MKLVGMFDSPYVRRVAISMRLLGVDFDHASWSIGKDQAAVAELNPLGTVPFLVLDDGEVIVDSSAILDFVDQLVGPSRALLPTLAEPRRRVLSFVTLALGVADKARLQASEYVFRPAALRHEPYVQRVRGQMLATAAALERTCAARAGTPWLFGDAITQADISLGCALTYAREAGGLDLAAFPALAARFATVTAMPVFREIYLPFDAPVVR